MKANLRSIKLGIRKDALIKSLVDVRSQTVEIAIMLPAAKQRQVFLGSWSPRELFAHLAGWDVTNRDAIDEIQREMLPTFYAFSDKNWATYNKQLVSLYGRDDFSEQIQLARNTHTDLITALTDLSPEEIWLDLGIRARGWKVTIGRLLEVEARDEGIHYQQLKVFAETV